MSTRRSGLTYEALIQLQHDASLDGIAFHLHTQHTKSANRAAEATAQAIVSGDEAVALEQLEAFRSRTCSG